MNEVLGLQQLAALPEEQELFPITITWTVTTTAATWSTVSNHC
ncbi:class III lanthipeptide [Paenibacillus bouchesdurhonensis]|nr:class III lanthipeptide [Paenibacillus bouchesdurhonensis]